MEGTQQSQSFWQFSDQLRLHSSNLANLSLNDSIWSVNNPCSAAKKPETRRNFDVTVGGGVSGDNKVNMNVNVNVNPPSQVNSSDYNAFSNDGWKLGSGFGSGYGSGNANLNGGFNKGVYSSSKGLDNNYNINNNINNVNNTMNYVNNYNIGKYNYKGQKNLNWKGEDDHGINVGGGKHGKKNKDVKKDNNDYNKEKNNENYGNNNNGKSGVDKRFKTLPAAEALPRNEIVGGYIFVCNNDTMEENLKRQLFGLPPRYRDSVRQITPGLPLFLYNYSTHQLHGIYEASSFGGTNIDPAAWEDKKNPGESRFPAQVRVHTRKLCEPLDEDAFRPILHHYDGPKFRLELSVPEALSLLDIFDENNA